MKTCGKLLDESELIHCSDECLLDDIKNSKSVSKDNAQDWEEKSDHDLVWVKA